MDGSLTRLLGGTFWLEGVHGFTSMRRPVRWFDGFGGREQHRYSALSCALQYKLLHCNISMLLRQSMNWPPLMVSVEPVIQAASSAARNTTQRAPPSASPSRPTGIWPTIAFITSSDTPDRRSVAT